MLISTHEVRNNYPNRWEMLGGLVEVNPPFDEDLVLRAANFCQSCLEEAELGLFAAVKHLLAM